MLAYLRDLSKDQITYVKYKNKLNEEIILKKLKINSTKIKIIDASEVFSISSVILSRDISSTSFESYYEFIRRSVYKLVFNFGMDIISF